MEALDGNAIAGALYDTFGDEMTTRTGVCQHCGAANLLAELRVYARAPGTVARCPSCGNVVLVLVDARGRQHVHLELVVVDGAETDAPGGSLPGSS